MGYNIRITREPQWDEPGAPIEEDEWADYVDEDDELEWDEENGPYSALWTGPGDGTPLWYKAGSIETKNPSELALCKMYYIAERLCAVVEGQEGELYNARGQQFYTPEHQAFLEENQKRLSKPSGNVFKRLLGLK